MGICLLKENNAKDSSLSEDARYHLLVDAVTDYAIYVLDPNGIVSTWNSGAQRIKGYSEQEIVGQHFSRFYTEEDKAVNLPVRVLEIAAHEGKFENEGWRLRKNGEAFWAHVVIHSIRDADGNLVGFAKVTRDLSERKKSEEALKRSEEQFRMLVQGVTDYAIYMLDPNGRITNWNSGAQRIKGYLPEEIIGEHFSRFYTPEDREAGEPQRSLNIAITQGKFEKEALRVRKDGTRFWASVLIDPIRNEAGELLGFAKVTRDISERKEAQRALEEAHEKLIQSQKMEVIGRLTGGVAHDFNNLLMAVLGSLELLGKYLPDHPRAKRLFENAFKGAERGASLTQRMLAFARRQELDFEAVDAPTLVRGMSELLQRSLGPEVRIETRFPLGLPKIRADANQLELALLNLAVNARDAMDEEGVISISAREEKVREFEPETLKPGHYVCLSVTDTGEGMDEKTLGQATDPFFTTKGVGKGTGLGLSMVHGLMEQSGGQLLLKSAQGKGTTAELWFPLAETKAPASAPEATGKPGPADMRPIRVLAVDDDMLVLMSTVGMLEDMGHTVIDAVSGAEALKELEQQNFDLVITDQSMPHMTGDQLSGIIQKRWPQVKIILATGYAELPSGVATDLPRLPKPFRMEELARIMTTVMN